MSELRTSIGYFFTDTDGQSVVRLDQAKHKLSTDPARRFQLTPKKEAAPSLLGIIMLIYDLIKVCGRLHSRSLFLHFWDLLWEDDEEPRGLRDGGVGFGVSMQMEMKIKGPLKRPWELMVKPSRIVAGLGISLRVIREFVDYDGTRLRMRHDLRPGAHPGFHTGDTANRLVRKNDMMNRVGVYTHTIRLGCVPARPVAVSNSNVSHTAKT
ncbi:MAG: hypothetical protein Q9221_003471 [Calogaya cf. arnoldii]